MNEWEPRFWAKVKKTDECWLWTAAKIPAGYGRFGLAGKTVYAHRVAYELLVGPIPEGLVIDHLCNVTSCVNPDHLRAVTSKENVARSGVYERNATATHCKRGHEFTPENTLVRPTQRQCRECWRAACRRANAKRKVKQ